MLIHRLGLDHGDARTAIGSQHTDLDAGERAQRVPAGSVQGFLCKRRPSGTHEVAERVLLRRGCNVGGDQANGSGLQCVDGTSRVGLKDNLNLRGMEDAGVGEVLGVWE